MKTKFAAVLCALAMIAFCGGSSTAGSLTGGIWSNGTVQHLYVSDPGSRSVLRYAMQNGIPSQRPDAEIGGFKLPRGIAIGPDNRLYVVDAVARQLLIFEPSPHTGSKPSHVLTLEHGWGLATLGVDGAGYVYVGYKKPCGYLGPCGMAAVYAPLPSGTQKPIVIFGLGGSPPVAFVSALSISPTRHLAAVSAGQPGIYYDVPKHKNQTPYFLFCPVAAYAAVWGTKGDLFTTDLGQPSNPPRAPQVYVIPYFLHGEIPNCPAYYSITSATVPLNDPVGITEQQGLLYVTTAYNATVGSGIVFVFDSTKHGAQVPVAILGGPASELRSPWGVAIGP